MSTTVTTRELKKMIDNDERFIMVNILDNDAYEQEHISGSINIPLGDIEKEALDLVDTDEKVVVYGFGPGSTAVREAAEKLASLGYREVIRYEGGMKEWTTEGLATEGTAIDRQRKAMS